MLPFIIDLWPNALKCQYATIYMYFIDGPDVIILSRDCYKRCLGKCEQKTLRPDFRLAPSDQSCFVFLFFFLLFFFAGRKLLVRLRNNLHKQNEITWWTRKIH